MQTKDSRRVIQCFKKPSENRAKLKKKEIINLTIRIYNTKNIFIFRTMISNPACFSISFGRGLAPRMLLSIILASLLLACGGGSQVEQESTLQSGSIEEIWIDTLSDLEDVSPNDMRRELEGFGFPIEQSQDIDGHHRFLLLAPASEVRATTLALKNLTWVSGTVSNSIQQYASAVASTPKHPTIKSAAIVKAAATRIKATLKYRVFPNPTEGTNLCFGARTIPPEFNSHQEAYQDCVARTAAQSDLLSLGALTPEAGNLVDSSPERMSAPALVRVPNYPTWYPLGYTQITGFSRAICADDKALVEETTTLTNGQRNTNYWCEDTAEDEPEKPVETDSTDEQAGMCTPNPIIPASGEKKFHSRDVNDQAPHPLALERTYRTQWQIDPQAKMGTMWSHNHSENLRQDANDSTGNTLILQLNDGAQRWFKRTSATAIWVNSSHGDQLVAATTAGGVPAWRYTRRADDSQRLFTRPTPVNPIGLMQSQRQRDGWTYNYTYNASGQLEQIRNEFNRTLSLTYHPSGLLATAVGPDNRTVRYVWDTSSRLSRVTYPGGKYLSYIYGDGNFPTHITGIIDENRKRYQTVSYDSLGRAQLSTLAGNAERYAVNYASTEAGFNDSATITDPIGTTRTFGYTQTNGHTSVTTGSGLPGCKGEAPIASRVQTPDGLLESETDFKGNITRYSWDATRQLLRTVTRGENTPRQQLTTIDWHDSFALPTLITERLFNTEYDYDEAGRLLNMTVTHTGGASAGKVQVTTYTYNAKGLVATVTEPNGAITTFSHFNTSGMPQRVTNALGHVTAIVYDTMGRPRQITMPNGGVRKLSYNFRGWLMTSSETANGITLATGYTYTDSGQLKTVTQPNGYVITYQHDDAHRVIGWTDNRGQSAIQTLDGLGNVTLETTTNSNGSTALQISREINAINRLERKTLGANIATRYEYDPNGQIAKIIDTANRSTKLTRDALLRVNTITNALGKVAKYGYNGQDAIVTAIDFKGVRTAYGRDAQGNPRVENSTDVGRAVVNFDEVGLPTRVTDAMGRATATLRDPLGRPTRITHSAAGAPATVSVLVYDQAGNGCNAAGHPNASKGKLCVMTDRSGGVNQVVTRYQWDSFGRLTKQTQSISSAIADHSQVQTTAYSYVASGPGAGQLASLTYPSGSVLTHAYDATGRLTTMSLDGQPLLADIQYNALEQPLSWSWAFATNANGLAAQRVYNTAGMLVNNTGFGIATVNNLGQYVGLKQGLFKPDTNGIWRGRIASFSATYTALGELKSFNASNTAEPALQYAYTYAYDANSNRRSGSTTLDGTTTNFTNTIPATSNRPTTQAGTPVVTNAAGDVTSLLGKAIAYDAAGRVSQVTAIPPCPSGVNCSGSQTTLSRHNGHNQRYLRENPDGQTVFTYAPDGYSVLAEVNQTLVGATTVANTTETVYLPTASGPMPVVALINGEPFAVYTDHLNTPRRLTDAQGRPRWQWAFSGFGEQAAQSIPRANLPTIQYSLRYPGQVDDGNGLFYNFNRFYDPLAGRYTQADPIGLEGGWNRFGYVGGNAMGAVDPTGKVLMAIPFIPAIAASITGTDLAIGVGLGVLGYGLDRIFAKPGNESRPTDAPSGTIPIDQAGLGRGDVHDIKGGVQNGPKDWTGIAPNGDVITSDPHGNAVNNGPADSFTRRPTGLCK